MNINHISLLCLAVIVKQLLKVYFTLSVDAGNVCTSEFFQRRSTDIYAGINH